MNKSSKNFSQLSIGVMILLQLAHQDSSLRFSTIGNWLKLHATKSTNEIKFLKSIKVYSRIANLRQTIAESIGIAERLQTDDVLKSFLLDAKRFQFEIEETESFYVIDSVCLEYADKQALLSQSSNLNYLVWHTMVRSQIERAKIGSRNATELYKCMPYRKKRSFQFSGCFIRFNYFSLSENCKIS